MGFFFDAYNQKKPGKGVEKTDYEPRFPLYFALLGRKFGKLIQLNLLYIIACLPMLAVMLLLYLNVPGGTDAELVKNRFFFQTGATLYLSVVGIGFFATGFVFDLRCFARQRHAWVFSDFKAAVKSNFRPAFILFAVDTAAVYLIAVALRAYALLGDGGPLFLIVQAFILVCALVYFMMHFYIYPILVSFRLPMSQVLRDALLITLGHLPWNCLILLIITAFSALLWGIFPLIGGILALLFGVALIGYTVQFMVDPLLDRYLYIPATVLEEQGKLGENDEINEED